VIPDNNVVLLYQPPHCPELNPIERVWEDLKRGLKGDNFASAQSDVARVGHPDFQNAI
jgi:transposase